MNVQSMRFNRLDLNLLIGLDVLLAECNITRAARRLCLSQSAASGILARLREYFGDDLLVQSGRRMVPTPLALSLMEPVRDILLRIERTVETAAEFRPEAACRHFRVVASDYVSAVVLTGLGARIADVAPGVTLEILPPNEHAMVRMERGEIDVLLMPERYLSRTHPYEALFPDRFSCIVWDGNTEVGETLGQDDYLRLGHAATSFGSHHEVAFEEAHFKSIGLSRRIEVVCATFHMLPQFVVDTRRIATLQHRLALQLARHYPIRVLEPPLAIPAIVECMQWHPSNQHEPAHVWLRSLLRHAAPADAHADYRATPSTQPDIGAVISRTGPSIPESRNGALAA
ncbi:LysR family transcriptional regulator [Telluria mixta]|uniref:LysR family transcriptional regulator n=1 Tax=Telluria mixta TaxID=34071 RepID=A0ABT2BYP9_9BURK|nr:LysR family transcriptional regulator [Telluria mixta]MCS0630255.1 LysR family transcriptional regulator [Telluria mixta]WEM94436.1 LysR family transcriptional regulator [Telluria mixta]